MMPLVLAALLALGPGSPPAGAPPNAAQDGPAMQLSDEEIRARIEAFLGSIDTPIPAAQWRALGPKAGPMLEQMATDLRNLPTRRARALDGLARVGSPGAPQLFVQLAQSESEPLVVRLSALHGAERALRKDNLVPALRPVLQSASSPHLRRAAADALARHGGCGLVREQAQKEDEPELMTAALARCEKR